MAGASTIFKRVRVWIRSTFSARRKEVAVVVTDETGFSIQFAAQPAERTRWADVCRIATFKRDLFAVDDIRLALELDDGTTLELSEEIGGFVEFAKAIEQHYGIDSNWMHRVTTPPFATNYTELWVRDDVAGRATD